jgi:hypothetical protein
MKKKGKGTSTDEMRPHYDFSGAVRGKHAKRYAEGTNVVLLAPDVAQVFKNADDVNRALRSLIEVADRVSAGKVAKAS